MTVKKSICTTVLLTLLSQRNYTNICTTQLLMLTCYYLLHNYLRYDTAKIAFITDIILVIELLNC